MVYKVIGIMSGSSLDGVDIVYAFLQKKNGTWSYELVHTQCLPYTDEWVRQLKQAPRLSGLDLHLLDVQLGLYFGHIVQQFISQYELDYQVDIVCSHGHTVYHYPQQKMTCQIGSGAAIASVVGVHVIDQLRLLDVLCGGQGAPIVPLSEQLLFPQHSYFLNIGGIVNIAHHHTKEVVAFDVCPGNAVLNYFAAQKGFLYDDLGNMAAQGAIDNNILQHLNATPYFAQHYPKSLDNGFASQFILPHFAQSQSIEDALATYTECIAIQVAHSVNHIKNAQKEHTIISNHDMLITGGGAFNEYLLQRLRVHLQPLHVRVVVPDDKVVKFKEALAMCLMGVLRWREEPNVLTSVTGAQSASCNGCIWFHEKNQ